MGQHLIDIQGLAKTYTLGDVTVHALRGVSLQIERGSFVAINNSALAINDDHIAALSSFQTEFQLRLLWLNCEASQFIWRRTCLTPCWIPT